MRPTLHEVSPHSNLSYLEVGLPIQVGGLDVADALGLTIRGDTALSSLGFPCQCTIN